MKTITCRVHGGIGNQLFCYAAARALSVRNNVSLKIDHISGFKNDRSYKRNYSLDYFRIPCEKIDKPISKIYLKLLKSASIHFQFFKKYYLLQKNIDYDPSIVNLKINNNIYIEGYWQSEKYFKDIDKIIRSDLEFVIPLKISSLPIVSKIKSANSVAIHVRFFDNLNVHNTNNISKNYYIKSMKEIEKKILNPQYFIFSNDIKAAKKMGIWKNKDITFMTFDDFQTQDYIDLWLMSLCNHFIIANSTFSWWAAWLSKSKNKIIFAPKKEIRHGIMWWGFNGLIPENWIKL